MMSLCFAFKSKQDLERYVSTCLAMEFFPSTEGKMKGNLWWFAPASDEIVWWFQTKPLLMSMGAAWCTCNEKGHGEVGRGADDLHEVVKRYTEQHFNDETC